MAIQSPLGTYFIFPAVLGEPFDIENPLPPQRFVQLIFNCFASFRQLRFDRLWAEPKG